MKKTIQFCAVVFLMLFMTELAQAQGNCCPTFNISNARACDITVFWETSDCNAPNAIQASGTVVIPAGASTSISSVPGGAGDVFIWLLEIDYTDVTGGGNTYAVSGGTCLWPGLTTNTGPVPSTVSSACAAVNIYTLIWTPSGCTIQ